MTRKSFTNYLSECVFVSVEIDHVHGDVVSFVVRLMYRCDPHVVCMARYDTAHGCPHRDVLNASGRLIEKNWLLGLSFSEALNYAIHDFKKNHESYLSEFKKRKAKRS